MGRNIKRNADYFPHKLSGKKMRYLRKKYGNDAYVIWFMLLEQLTAADDHHIVLDEFNSVLLADEFMVSIEKLENVINELVKIGSIHKELWEEKRVVYSEKLRDSIEYAYSKRTNDCITTNGLKRLFDVGNDKTDTGNDKTDDGKTRSEVKGSEEEKKIKKEEGKKKRKRFEKPTQKELKEYFLNAKIPNPENLAQRFINHYESNGWKVGKNKMVSWKGAAGNWAAKRREEMQTHKTEQVVLKMPKPNLSGVLSKKAI